MSIIVHRAHKCVDKYQDSHNRAIYLEKVLGIIPQIIKRLLMEYYIFDEVSPNSDAPFLDLPDEIDLIESIMGKKPKFDELPIKIEAEIDKDEEVVYTDIINPGVPLFSPKMKEALDELGVSNIDYYPVHIIDYDTREVLLITG